MKKFFRVLGVVAAVVVLLVVALAVAAKILITPERVRAAVLPVAREALHRDVELGEISVSLFRGITLHDLSVSEPEGGEPFVAADAVVLRYQLLPLLFRHVVVDEVRLDAPRIRIERLPEGRFNFSDLLPGEAAEAGKAPDAPAAAGDDGLPFDLHVARVAVRDGLVRFLDRVISPSAPLEYKVQALNVVASDISLQEEFPFTVQARVADAPLDVEGRVNPASRQVQAKVKLGDLDVTAFSPYYAGLVPGKLGSLKLALDLQVAGGAQSVSSQGVIELKQLDLLLKALPEAPLRGVSASLDYNVDVDLARSRIEVETAKADINGIPIQFSGGVADYTTAPAVDLQVAIPGLELRKAIAALPPSLLQGVSGLDPAGTVDLRAHLAGPAAAGVALLQTAEVRLDGVQANIGALRPALSGRLNLKGDTLASDGLEVVAGDNRAAVELKAGNLFGRPLSVVSRVTSERFNIQSLLPQKAASPEGDAGKAPPQAAKATEIGPLDLPLRVDGSVQIAQTLYKGLSIDKFDLHFLLEKNVLTVDRLTGNVAQGSFSQTARIDLARKGLAYATRLSLKDVQADAVVSAFSPKAAGTLFGTLALDADLAGSGTLPETLRQNLSGKGAFHVADGKLTGAGLVQELAAFVDLEELRVVRFSEAKGSFTVTNGKVGLKSDFSGSDARLTPVGTVGLDGALDVALDLRLSPALTARLDRGGKVSQFLADKEGWGQVPLKISGTASSPRFALDTSIIKDKAKEKAREEIQKQLQEKLFDKLAPKGGESEEVPAKKILEDSLKGLLGR